jgi:hypothetical protein
MQMISRAASDDEYRLGVETTYRLINAMQSTPIIRSAAARQIFWSLGYASAWLVWGAAAMPALHGTAGPALLNKFVGQYAIVLAAAFGFLMWAAIDRAHRHPS